MTRSHMDVGTVLEVLRCRYRLSEASGDACFGAQQNACSGWIGPASRMCEQLRSLAAEMGFRRILRVTEGLVDRLDRCQK